VDDVGVRPRSLMDDLTEEDEGEQKLTATRHSTSVLDDGFCVYEQEECMAEDHKKGSFFRGLFSYSKLRANRRTHSEHESSCEKKGTRPSLGKWLSSKKSKAQSK
jgi:hypothetical protein